MRKTLFATGGIVASIFLGASVTLTKAETIAPQGKGHLQKSYLVDKSTRSVLRESGLGNYQMKDAYANAKIHGFKKNVGNRGYIRSKAPSVLVAAQASVLGLSIDELKKSFQNGQSLADITKAQGLTEKQYNEGVIEKLEDLIDSGTLKGKQAKAYQKMIERLQNKNQ